MTHLIYTTSSFSSYSDVLALILTSVLLLLNTAEATNYTCKYKLWVGLTQKTFSISGNFRTGLKIFCEICAHDEYAAWNPHSQGPELQKLDHTTFLFRNTCKYHSYTPHVRALCSQSEFRILRICESSACALFLYNCTANTFMRAWA